MKGGRNLSIIMLSIIYVAQVEQTNELKSVPGFRTKLARAAVDKKIYSYFI